MSIPVKQRTLLRQGRSPRVYSVSFRDSGPSPRGVRRDAAVGMVAEVAVGGGSVRNDFDKLSVFQRPICNATWDKEARAWRDFVWQGEQGFSFSPTQPYREVLYQCRPFWYRIDYSGEFAPSFVSVAEEHVPGYSLAPMFQNGTDPVYRPCFQMGLGEDGLPHSRAGLAPYIDKPAQLYAAVRSYDAAARPEGMEEIFSDWVLMMVEFATKQMHTLMQGRIKGTVQNYHIDLVEAGNALETVTASSGTPQDDGYCAMVWRGKENAWGNATSWIWNIMANVEDPAQNLYRIYHLSDFSKWTGKINSDHSQSDCLANISHYRWITSLSADSTRPWLISPVSVEDNSRYGVGNALMRSGQEELFLYATGYSYSAVGVGPLKMTFMNIAATDRRIKAGARLILQEG